MARARVVIAAPVLVTVLLTQSSLPAEADVDLVCLADVCDLTGTTEDDFTPPTPPLPLGETPTNPGPATIETIAHEYSDLGVERCLWQGIRTDEEADLAQIDVTRPCEEDEADPAADDAADDAPTWEEIVTFVASAYETLQLEPSPITYQPEGDWALINMDFIVHTDPTPQTFDVDLLPGLQVTFRATPVHYTWDFGDGATLETSSPGNPYPDHDVAHVYTSTHDAVAVSLTTLWQGTFQINGAGPWLPVSTYNVTTATTDPVEIVAMDVALVPNDA